MTRPFVRPLLVEPDKPHQLINQRLGAVLATEVVGAFDSKSRRTGLLEHKLFAPGSALIIAPTSAIHTFFMRFDIDAAFVARDGRVLKIYSRLPPWRLAAALWAFAVIEMPAGSLDRSGTLVGDRVVIQ